MLGQLIVPLDGKIFMVMEGVELLFVDTNILVYATDGLSPWYQTANEALQTARDLDVELFISTQILREYLAATTRINRTGSGAPLIDILANINVFRTEFTVVEENLSVFAALLNLLQRFPTAGRQVYDANIVATMQVYGIPHLLTHNTADFTRFAQAIAILPLEGSP